MISLIRDWLAEAHQVAWLPCSCCSFTLVLETGTLRFRQ